MRAAARRAVLHLDALDLAGAHEWDAGTGLKKVRLAPHVVARFRL